jgi:hypothetical protein
MERNPDINTRAEAKLERYATYLEKKLDRVSWSCKICGLYIESTNKEFYENSVRDHQKFHVC